ncbi:Uncharacterised protein [Cedecea neteri]|uniref:Uncharacterized protein n=1 Tax=Cedecea neteri TaxID=158822 RepID=A0A291E3C1_9ENTR|nr:hypothetical protein [Cedecea neteri]ATF94574.1 hypothetical protein CO704_22020 [Cedecea neteri]SQA98038.1 Uncharacterised protein [Cedecea neteri]
MVDSVCYRNNRARWTVGDLTFLENNYSSLPVEEIAVRLGRTPGAVRLMADNLGCRKKKSAPWSEVEMDIIREHYSRGTEARFLTQLLPGRSISAIFSMAETLGVQSGRFWREVELDILKADYPRMGVSVTEHLPGRNAVSVRIMAKRLGLKKSRDSNVGFRPWSDEEWTLLEKNMHLSVAEQQATLFSYRTKRAVEKARERLLKKKRDLARDTTP